jgi:hypothetical protein
MPKQSATEFRIGASGFDVRLTECRTASCAPLTCGRGHVAARLSSAVTRLDSSRGLNGLVM